MSQPSVVVAAAPMDARGRLALEPAPELAPDRVPVTAAEIRRAALDDTPEPVAIPSLQQARCPAPTDRPASFPEASTESTVASDSPR